ncbi:MAG: glycosyltransferase family 2 protein [Candidatus Latescibacteria bacterium]|nr:glycosyltransferase family 2 protein [Candidatus Latescibacterota bacterium]
MKISGFSFVRNAIKLYYPIVESIQSMLPLVDEFVIACGDSEDRTTESIRAISDPKIKIIETVWDKTQFVRGASNAVQTNIALDACTGDWCFYLQADEVIHEKYIPVLRRAMERYLEKPEVEGLLFDYVHFYGSYDRYQTGHNWYAKEVRIVRNGTGVRSWQSAQGFRIDGRKLRVVPVAAEIYHYGWVRPPKRMMKKSIALSLVHRDADWVHERFPDEEADFDFGSLKTCRTFRGTHPKVMLDRISAVDWKVKPGKPNKKLHKHDRLRVRLLTFLENHILHRKLGEYKNYVLIDDPVR